MLIFSRLHSNSDAIYKPNLSSCSFSDWSSVATLAVCAARTTDKCRFESFVWRLRFELHLLAFRQTSETFHLYDRLCAFTTNKHRQFLYIAPRPWPFTFSIQNHRCTMVVSRSSCAVNPFWVRPIWCWRSTCGFCFAGLLDYSIIRLF